MSDRDGPSGYRSSLASLATIHREPDRSWVFEAFRSAWQDNGTFGGLPLSEIEQRRGFVSARKARLLAEELFGKRGAR